MSFYADDICLTADDLSRHTAGTPAVPGCTFSGLVASSMLTSPEKANTALHANELLEALKSPGVNGGVFNLTYVWNCINQASPGSADDFAR